MHDDDAEDRTEGLCEEHMREFLNNALTPLEQDAGRHMEIMCAWEAVGFSHSEAFRLLRDMLRTCWANS